MRSIIALFFSSVVFAADPSNGKKLTFSDEFDGDSFDTTKWIIEGSKETISIVKLDKTSVLRIGLKKASDMIQSNALSSRTKFSQQYGYFEASMRMNKNEGHSATFRIVTDDEKTPPSTHIVFYSPGKEQIRTWGRALFDSGQQDFRPDKFPTPSKTSTYSKKFHTYGMLWTEKGFQWYIDGKVVHKLDRKEFTRPMHIAFSHRILEEDRYKLDLNSLPDDFDIDWVKVWK